MNKQYYLIGSIITMLLLMPLTTKAQTQRACQLFPTTIHSQQVGELHATIHPTNQSRRFPYLYLNQSESLTLHFDLFDNSPSTLYYRIDACQADWTRVADDPLSLHCEPIRGLIDSPQPSKATTVPYWHYQLTLQPGRNALPNQSGNYLITVSRDYDAYEPLCQLAFALVEPLINVNSRITYSSGSHYDQQQQVEIDLSHLDDHTARAEQEISVYVAQNGSSHRATQLLKPSMISHQNMQFHNRSAALFWAGYEYNACEILTDQYNGMGVNHHEVVDGIHRMILFTDRTHAQHDYLFQEDANGRYLIRNTDLANSDNMATDYYELLFTLESDDEHNANIILEGEAFDAFPIEWRTMRYNPHSDRYECLLLIKGGYISYRYTTVTDSQPYAANQPNTITGDYQQTTNHYTTFVYLRRPNDQQSRLIGISEAVGTPKIF